MVGTSRKAVLGLVYVFKTRGVAGFGVFSVLMVEDGLVLEAP